MTFIVRSADIGELTEHPEIAQQNGTATVLAGTGAFVAPISMLREIAAAPDAGQKLGDIVEALLEQEFQYAMAILDADVTGIENILWFQPVPTGEHGPRIKVAIDPPDSIRQGGVEATVPFAADKPASGPIPPALERQVRAFIELNKPALMDYWNLKITTNKFLLQLRPLPR
jgi:hypothetical protein